MSGHARFLTRWELEGVRGVVVAVDVLRAFTTAAYAFAAGASSIFLVATVREAIDLAGRIPGALTMGEEHGQRPLGFDFSNSPVEVSRADLEGRSLVQRTSAGTQGVIAAGNAERLFAASLVCASATAAAIDFAGLGAPTYVITGRFPDALHDGEEDLLAAELIERARCGLPLDEQATVQAVASSPSAGRILAMDETHAHSDDVAYATAVDRFDFAMEVEVIDGRHRMVARTHG
ncbi:MAG: 2-phosphosulfolactate phosphatase [Acidimicrobiales bacterium]|jgi:2-phosphosulfolactate phosphatase